jgi:cellobiose-specific phosphotransferase system component IIC
VQKFCTGNATLFGHPIMLNSSGFLAFAVHPALSNIIVLQSREFLRDQ